ncbi:MAG: serine/threonine-protein kinase [Steroidobacter sp.]
MNSQRWQQIKRVFTATLERPAGERISYLQLACGADDDLLAEVCSLLEAESCTGDFTEPTALNAPSVEWKGRRLGSYRIVSEIGRGGMSHVYKAVRDDDQYHKQVAIKLLRPGLHTQSLLQRFRAERQMLAELNHPNIAQLLDGGVTDTQAPYLVMEYIEGRPIDVYCEERSLSIRKRLELMRTLCGAVHYVHRHLVVHGDLKGNNILVTDNGVVKLLDFGIAKLLTTSPNLDNPVGTMLTWFALTPEYASPEQSRGEAVTTASDVYSIGVLLYRLLSGTLPFETTRDAFMANIAADRPDRVPPVPSIKAAQGDAFYCEAVREVRGDLDAIVMKAMRPDPHDRYGSAEHLAEDLTRYLRGVPVHARPGTATYRLTKFVQRHKAASISTSLFATAFLAAVVATGWQTHIVSIERERAERHYSEVRELTNTYLRDVYDAASNLPGATAVRKLLVENSLKHISALEDEAEDSLEFQRDLAWAYQKFGDVQGDYLGANLGDTQGAVESYRRALRLREQIAARSTDRDDRAQLLRSHVALSELLAAQSHVEESVQQAQSAVRVGEELVPRLNATNDDLQLLAIGYTTLGTALGAVDTTRAMIALGNARVLFERVAAEIPKDPKARRNLALVSSRIGQVYLHDQRPRAALPHYLRALELAEGLLSENPLSADIKRASSFMLATIADAYNQLREPDNALSHARTALERLEALRVADPANEQAPLAVAYVLNRLGESYLLKSELDDAFKNLQRAADLIAQSPAAKPTDIAEVRLLPGTTALLLGKTHALLANRERRVQHRKDAADLLQRSVASLRQLTSDPVLGKQAKLLSTEAEQLLQTLS